MKISLPVLHVNNGKIRMYNLEYAENSKINIKVQKRDFLCVNALSHPSKELGNKVISCSGCGTLSGKI